MSLTLSIEVRRAGSLADADATPTLSNAAAGFGIRRVSDSAVIVAAGTAMTRVSAGIYTYAFSTAVVGVVYEYSIRALIGGVPYYKQETTQLAGESSTSYLTVTQADALAASLPNLTSWNAASSSAKAAALELASQRFDLARRYQGRKYECDSEQPLEFPRIAYADTVWDWDSTNNVAIVPPRVYRAVLFEADAILQTDHDRIAQAIHDGLVSQSNGSVSESYRKPEETPVLCREADLVSRHYQPRSGSLL